MKLRLAIAALLVLSACSNPASRAVRGYNGTASVGDFFSISLNPTALTLAYSDYSNGSTGTVPYTVNTDGTFTFTDSTGNLVSGYEVPNYALLIEAEKAGPSQNTPALITSVEASPITQAAIENQQYNFLGFRTTSGGLEAGSLTIDGQGDVSVNEYWPYGATMGQSPNPFNSGSFPGTNFHEDPSGNFLTLTETQQGVTSTDYIFGTASGLFIVDTPNGSIMSMKKAATKNFDPSVAGTYKAVYYQKMNASVNQNNQESGTPSLGQASIVVDAVGNVTITDSQSNVLLAGALSAVADTSYLYGSAGELTDPCNGLFTFRIMHGSQPQDVFVTFLNNSLLFGSFSPVSPSGSGYDYFYGVGLK